MSTICVYGERVRNGVTFDASIETILPRVRNYEWCGAEEKVGQGEKMSHAQLSILTRKRQARGVKGRLGHPLCRPLSLSGPAIFLSAQAGI